MKKITDLNDLLLFVTLVEAGSFTQAAKKLNIAKSKLSRRLAELEAKLGVELLLRTTRKQQLTDSGRLLFCASKNHVEALTKVEEEFALSINQLQGKISILLPLEFFNKVISSLIADFLQLYPEIQVTCHHYSGDLPDFDPQYDLSFVLHEQPLAASNWIGKELLSFPQSIYLSAELMNKHADLLVGDKALAIEQLTDIDCILSQSNQPWLFRQGAMVRAIYVKGRAVLSSPEMRLQACQQGLGLCKLPDYVLPKSADELAIKKLTLAQAPVAQRLTVLYQSRHIAAKTRAFLDYFQSHIAKLL